MDRLASIKKRLSNATPGPWTLYKCDDYLTEEDRACGINGHSFDCSYDECHHPLNLNDAELIANAPADIEYLLQRIERSEKALNRLYLTCPIPALSPFDEESHRTEYVEAIAETAEVLTEIIHGK